jgi:Uma2 family endonuclease
MSTITLVSVGEYLASSYRPDREFIDGSVEERDVGEWGHARLQRAIIVRLDQYETTLGLLAAPECRVQVKPTRFRVPDITVTRGEPGERILTRPPFLVIEILSPEDSMSSMQERIDDYLTFGVENLWILDPRRRKAFWADANGIHEAPDAVLHAIGEPVSIDLAGLWPTV